MLKYFPSHSVLMADTRGIFIVGQNHSGCHEYTSNSVYWGGGGGGGRGVGTAYLIVDGPLPGLGSDLSFLGLHVAVGLDTTHKKRKISNHLIITKLDTDVCIYYMH